MIARKQLSAAFWATVVVVVGLAYVLSFGPACWITSRIGPVPEWAVAALGCFYHPLLWAMTDGPEWLRIPLAWWAELGVGILCHRFAPTSFLRNGE